MDPIITCLVMPKRFSSCESAEGFVVFILT